MAHRTKRKCGSSMLGMRPTPMRFLNARFFSVDRDVVCLQDMIENTLSIVSNHLAARAEALKLALRCINRYKVARGIANSRILGAQSGRRRAEEQLARALACLANALESDGFNTKRFSSHRVKMHQDGLRHRKLVGFASHPAHWKYYSHLLLSRYNAGICRRGG